MLTFDVLMRIERHCAAPIDYERTLQLFNSRLKLIP